MARVSSRAAGAALLVTLCGLAEPGARLAGQAVATRGGVQASEPSATRADLAVSYLAFEKALLAASLDAAETTRVNKAFDALTFLFFARDYVGAIRQLDALTASMGPSRGAADLTRLSAYRVRVSPPVYVPGTGRPAVTVERLYASDVQSAPSTSTCRLKGPGPTAPIDLPITLTPAPGVPAVAEAALAAAIGRVKPGRYEVGLTDGRAFLPTGTWSVVSKPLAARAATNAEALNTIEAATPALLQAKASTRARNALLVDSPDPGSTVQMLADPEVLAGEVEREILALRQGRNPFAGRAGDYWRVLQLDARAVPLRVYRPASAPAGPAGWPLVIALHGAGGDENMFMDAYGGGLIKRLADQHGFLVASPQTAAFSGPGAADAFDRLVEALALDYPLDRSRVFVVGHSAGGMAASGLLAARPDRIAAAACLNGFSGIREGVTTIPPTFVSAGEFDPLIPPARIEPAAQRAKASGLPVEYHLVANYGHTLAVAKILPEAIAWMFAKAPRRLP